MTPGAKYRPENRKLEDGLDAQKSALMLKREQIASVALRMATADVSRPSSYPFEVVKLVVS